MFESVCCAISSLFFFFFFVFNDTATTEIYTLSLHDALPISGVDKVVPAVRSVLVDRRLVGQAVLAVSASEVRVVPAVPAAVAPEGPVDDSQAAAVVFLAEDRVAAADLAQPGRPAAP